MASAICKALINRERCDEYGILKQESKADHLPYCRADVDSINGQTHLAGGPLRRLIDLIIVFWSSASVFDIAAMKTIFLI